MMFDGFLPLNLENIYGSYSSCCLNIYSGVCQV